MNILKCTHTLTRAHTNFSPAVYSLWSFILAPHDSLRGTKITTLNYSHTQPHTHTHINAYTNKCKYKETLTPTDSETAFQTPSKRDTSVISIAEAEETEVSLLRRLERSAHIRHWPRGRKKVLHINGESASKDLFRRALCLDGLSVGCQLNHNRFFQETYFAKHKCCQKDCMTLGNIKR